MPVTVDLPVGTVNQRVEAQTVYGNATRVACRYLGNHLIEPLRATLAHMACFGDAQGAAVALP